MHYGIGKIPIVCQQEKPLRVEIKSSYRKHSVFYTFQKILYSSSPFRIKQGRHNTSWLIEHQIHFSDALPKPCNQLSSNPYVIFFRICLHSNCCNLAINSHFSLKNEFLRFSPRSNAHFRDNLLKPFFHEGK